MFILVSVIISLGILFVMYRYSRQQQHKLERRYQLIVHLRDLVNLIRQHRSITHFALMSPYKKNRQIDKVEQEIDLHCQDLIQLAHFNNKPMYRVLHNNIALLIRSWKRSNVNKNQMIHGKMVRHTLLLIDELIVAWLVDLEQEELELTYSEIWHGVIDCLDCLTQFRMCIQNSDTTMGKQQLLHYCHVMQRKMNRLSVKRSCAVVRVPMRSAAMNTIDDMLAHPEKPIDKEAMYQLSSTLSDNIFQTYDECIGELAETLYLPLPKTAVV
ncbi:hypothetical protein BCU70_12435 [Vibrio sp. 10N.286.49.C2]|uniref:hypothetical protein n=1 Tax=unclassified Vibrio TaxID=2614977 RepID=UPI000C86125F|nr:MULTISPECIES: hypothetical protein [unclassified Vibrio]PMH39624.1 hypothetical protein BCU70_12435 [Vibrio sp. 10N.286.49.C2]PMH57757.1 hypothetical protein BCU66_00440 [Vibrio sp. 10N.286.49.B1]PMH81418.1 hypothetical protein BCU58_02755 [Vibrio sp. 10N.286.48.B7]